MRATLLWSALVTLVVLGVFFAVARILALADIAASVTTARVAAVRMLYPEYLNEFLEFEQHFPSRAGVTIVHLTTGAAFLILGLLQFSVSIRTHYLRFHRRSGYVLVAFALSAGATGVYLGVVDPVSSFERVPSTLAGTAFVISPMVAIAAVRRGQVRRHREWMIRFFAIGVGIVVIRLVDPPMIWLLSPAPLGDIIGLSFWVGWLLSAGVAEAWIRSTRREHSMMHLSGYRKDDVAHT